MQTTPVNNRETNLSQNIKSLLKIAVFFRCSVYRHLA